MSTPTNHYSTPLTARGKSESSGLKKKKSKKKLDFLFFLLARLNGGKQLKKGCDLPSSSVDYHQYILTQHHYIVTYPPKKKIP